MTMRHGGAMRTLTRTLSMPPCGIGDPCCGRCLGGMKGRLEIVRDTSKYRFHFASVRGGRPTMWTRMT